MHGYTFDSGKRSDYFNRKKVGSIRDNPKLMKIRQQFENSAKESDSKYLSGSKSNILDESNAQSKSPKNGKIQTRRHSEGDCKHSSSLSRSLIDTFDKSNFLFSQSIEDRLNSSCLDDVAPSCRDVVQTNQNGSTLYINDEEISRTESKFEPLRPPKDYLNNAHLPDIETTYGTISKVNKRTPRLDSNCKIYSNSIETCSSDSIFKPLGSLLNCSYGTSSDNVKNNRSDLINKSIICCEKIYENATESTFNKYSSPDSLENRIENSETFSCSPPPLPRRGVSCTTQSFLNGVNNSPSKRDMILKEISSNDTKNVQKTIELYEGMSFGSKKDKMAKHYGTHRKTLRKEDSFSRLSHKRRSSFRKNRLLNECPPAPSRQHTEKTWLKEEETQNVYQTISSTVPSFIDDPYDRLSRIHDVLHQIHEGQTSTCAACKAIPSSVLQLQGTLELVKCHEVTPHHHPPCICFSCQHSVFSCSVHSAETRDNLYYNVCCLNPPDRDSWRQSRRRPVCEQNGRLCVVNCDSERSAKMDEKEYENLSDCQSPQHAASKVNVVDSCESDEGWVDVTDSEDEESSFLMSDRNSSLKSEGKNCQPPEVGNIVSKCSNLNLSQSLSTEHLYESINELESHIEVENINVSASSTNEPIAETNRDDYSSKSDRTSDRSQREYCSHQDRIPKTSMADVSLKHNENDLDSGEWSTESGSPVFNESFNRSTSMDQQRFTVGYRQDTSKSSFMKSVLGKKGSHSKKRRMSNFFVPWLVSNNEYGAADSKLCVKKQTHSCKKNSSSSSTCPKEVYCSSEIKNRCENTESDDVTRNLLEASPTLSRSSSTYVRADELQSAEVPKPRKGSCESCVDVSVDRVCVSSGGSEHSYILFTPIKEDQVPLYQFYERNVKERVSFSRSDKSLSPVMWGESETKQPQMSVVEQLSPEAADMKMLWCELPEVKESGILERISAQELKLQEAQFEFIQSQASYVRSLKVLYENFIRPFSSSPSASSLLSKHEQDVLFSDIVHLKEVSERILYDVTARWNSILIPDICDIILRHAQLPSFSIYVKYCSNRVYQERTLKELKESRTCFLEALKKLECNPVCQGQSLESFLLLPMQHIARLPLLLDNIFRWHAPASFAHCKDALHAVHKIFMECNESARKMERLEEMFVLNKQLEFKECKVIPLISASRWLLKKGELVKLEFDKKTFGRSNRCARVPLFVFLFNDLLLITRRKNEECYAVLDYCRRERVQATAINARDLQQPLVSPNICRYLIYLKLLSNHQGLTQDLILNCTLLSERTRWIEAISSAGQNKPCEIWEYDCPQVQCFKNYIAQQPDELSLQELDVVTVHRKMDDGWYEGRRLRDGLRGWFPASCTMDIPCSRASNLRQCYRLLMLNSHKDQ